MQFEISDNMGVAFSNAFYTYLADGLSIERALANTRADLKADNFGEWISPVLYMRTDDGELFNLAPPCKEGLATSGIWARQVIRRPTITL